MTRTNRLALIAGLAVAMMFGCKNESDTGTGDNAAAGQTGSAAKGAMAKAGGAAMPAPASFAMIPSDTPYVIANSAPMPRDAMDKIFKALEPALAKLQTELAKEAARLGASESQDDKIGAAVLGELNGNLNRVGLEKLGISTEPHFAIYGVGLLPVFRVDLKDAAALKAAVARVEAKAGVKAPVMKTGEQEYWGVTKDGLTVLIAIVGNELVFAVTPEKAAAKTIPIILGQTKPAASLASTGALAKLAGEYGFKGYGTGYVDLKGIANIVLGRGKGLNGEVWAAMEAPMPPLSDVCQTEILGMVDNAPRLSFGYTEMTASKMAMSWIIETKPELGKALMALAAPVPGLGGSGSMGSMFSFGVGVDLGKTVEFLKGKVGAITAAPYKCEMLADLNGSAAEMQAGLSQPMPPFLNGIKGFNLVVKSADFSGPQPKDIKASVLLAIDKPMDLLNMAKGMVPPLASLEVKDDGMAVALPAGLVPPVVDAPHIAMKGSALALSVGAGEEKNLGAILAGKVDSDPPLLAVSYDMSKFSGMLKKQMEAQMAFLPPEMQAEKKAEMEMTQSIMQLFGALSYSMHLTDKGIVLKQQVVLN